MYICIYESSAYLLTFSDISNKSHETNDTLHPWSTKIKKWFILSPSLCFKIPFPAAMTILALITGHGF